MMSETITIKFSLHAPAKAIYDAWLNSAEHTAMTGAKATASRLVGGAFSAWDGYITGKNLLLIPGKKIVQSWRSSEFPDQAPDSILSIQLTEGLGITEIDLEHKDIPAGQLVQYQSGWIEFYVNPMQKYFALKSEPAKKKKAKTGKKTKVGKATKAPVKKGRSKTAAKKSKSTKISGGATRPSRRK
jgi:activator of HSP90 ATPase